MGRGLWPAIPVLYSIGYEMISEQNEKHNIERLAAQRHLYSLAKRILRLQFIVDIPAMLLLGLVAALIRSSAVMRAFGMQPYDITIAVAICGVVVALLDSLVFEHYAHSYRETAAQVQELFDCEVLELPWNDVFVGQQPEPEEVVRMSSAYVKDHGSLSELENWYPPITVQLPSHAARLVCQRENLWWDADLRRRYVSHIVLGAIAVLVFLFAMGMAAEFTLANFLALVFAPFMPMLVLTIRQVRTNGRSIASLDSLRQKCNGAIDSVLNGELKERAALQASRQIQDRIYSHRRDAALIPDLYYRIYQSSSESAAQRTVQDIVNDYLIRTSDSDDP